MAERTVHKWAVIRPDGVIDRMGTSGCRALFDRRCQAEIHARYSARKDRVVRVTITWQTEDIQCPECGRDDKEAADGRGKADA